MVCFTAPSGAEGKRAGWRTAEQERREARPGRLPQAFDAEGKPTKAAEGWARGNGITVEQAERLVTDKGEWLVHTAKVEGRPAVDLLGELVSQALAKLPIPKMMRWGDKTIQFVRPVFTVTLLLDGDLVPAHILGIDSARTIRGHRFMGERVHHRQRQPVPADPAGARHGDCRLYGAQGQDQG